MKETIGVAFKRKQIPIKDEVIDLSIWDFGGEEKYRVLFPSYVTGASGALILYDLTRKETLYDVENWVKIIDENTSDIGKLLIGTKDDLIDEREIPKEDIEKICNKFNFCSNPIETSAKTGNNVEMAFTILCEKIMEQKFQICKSCGKGFSKILKFCQFCGAKI